VLGLWVLGLCEARAIAEGETETLKKSLMVFAFQLSMRIESISLPAASCAPEMRNSTYRVHRAAGPLATHAVPRIGKIFIILQQHLNESCHSADTPSNQFLGGPLEYTEFQDP
jgi:hypothetical protein